MVVCAGRRALADIGRFVRRPCRWKSGGPRWPRAIYRAGINELARQTGRNNTEVLAEMIDGLLTQATGAPAGRFTRRRRCASFAPGDKDSRMFPQGNVVTEE